MNFQHYHSILLLFSFLAGCTISRNICPCEAPDVIRINKSEITITAQLCRADTTAANKINLWIKIHTIDGVPLPKGVEVNGYYLRSSNISKDAIEGFFVRKKIDYIQGIMELNATFTDSWEQNERAEVAVQMIDQNGKTHFIRKEGVTMRSFNQ